MYFIDCASQFTIRHRLIDHLKSHTQQKSCACPNCGTMFATFAKLKDHCRQSDNGKSELIFGLRALDISLYFSHFRV